MMARRVSTLLIVPEMEAAAAPYRALGFEPVDAGLPHCQGLRAGDTYLLLVATAGMRADYPGLDIAGLEGTAIPYVWVETVSEALRELPTGTEVMAHASSRTEVLVRLNGVWTILAEG